MPIFCLKKIISQPWVVQNSQFSEEMTLTHYILMSLIFRSHLPPLICFKIAKCVFFTTFWESYLKHTPKVGVRREKFKIGFARSNVWLIGHPNIIINFVSLSFTNAHLCSQSFHAQCSSLRAGCATSTSRRRLGSGDDQAPAPCHPFSWSRSLTSGEKVFFFPLEIWRICFQAAVMKVDLEKGSTPLPLRLSSDKSRQLKLKLLFIGKPSTRPNLGEALSFQKEKYFLLCLLKESYVRAGSGLVTTWAIWRLWQGRTPPNAPTQRTKKICKRIFHKIIYISCEFLFWFCVGKFCQD